MRQKAQLSIGIVNVAKSSVMLKVLLKLEISLFLLNIQSLMLKLRLQNVLKLAISNTMNVQSVVRNIAMLLAQLKLLM